MNLSDINNKTLEHIKFLSRDKNKERSEEENYKILKLKENYPEIEYNYK